MAFRFIGSLRCILALLGLSAVLTEIIALTHRGAFNAINFFSFFTIESNLLCVIMFALFGYSTLLRKHISHKLYVFKGATTLYMLMTGVIFALLLAPIENTVLTAVPWDNIVLHYIMPIAVCVDWLWLQPTVRISFRQSLSWLSFPALYVMYTLIRGHFVGWYPYPFLNAGNSGYAKVLTTVAILLVVVIGASQLVRVISGKLTHTTTTS